MPLELTDITIPEDRFGEGRTENDIEMKDLVRSIKRWGILEPVILDEENRLIAGERRLNAALRAGKTELQDDEYKYHEGLSELDKRRIELEENILRKDLSWAEQSQAIKEIHEIRSAEDPDWSMQQTAELLGVSKMSVSQHTQVAEQMEEDPDLGEKNTLTGALREIKEKKKLQERKEQIERQKKGRSKKSFKAEIQQGDALELIQDLPDESVDAIITNPPFGVDLEIKGLGEVYDDDTDYISDLIIEMCEEWYRVLRDDSWAVVFFDVNKITTSKYSWELYDELQGTDLERMALRNLGLKGWLELAGFDYVQPTPAVWVKPNKTQGLVGDTKKALISAYETFFFAAKGDPSLLEKGQQNVFTFNIPTSSDRVHPLQMPTDFTRRLAELVVLGGGLVHDSFAGSGSVGLGALDRQAEFLGFELDPEYAENGQLLLDEHVYSEAQSGE